MTAQSKATLKSYFEGGDTPTSGQFADLIDTLLVASSAPGGVNTVGRAVVSAASTAIAQAALGGRAAGIGVFEASTTASSQSVLGSGVAGRQVFAAATTAVARASLHLPSTYDFPLSVGSAGQVMVSDGSNAQWDAAMPRAYLAGLTLANNGSDATNDIDIAVGACRDSTNVTNMVLASALTKQLDAAWAVGTNQGMRDTGAISNATWHLFVIMRPDTGVVDVLASLSATSPSLPTNYTYFRRIGSIIRSGGAIVLFSQNGDEFLRSASILDIDVTNAGTSAVLRTLSVPTGIKVWALFNLFTEQVATNFALYVSSPDQSDESPNVTAAPLVTIGNTEAAAPNQYWLGGVKVRTNTSAQIRTRQSLSGAGDIQRIATLGWIDTRGRDD